MSHCGMDDVRRFLSTSASMPCHSISLDSIKVIVTIVSFPVSYPVELLPKTILPIGLGPMSLWDLIVIGPSTEDGRVCCVVRSSREHVTIPLEMNYPMGKEFK